MLPEPDLTRALDRISPQPKHGFYSRFVEFRHLCPHAAHKAAEEGSQEAETERPKPLWGLGSKRHGGRFTPKESFETIYCAEDAVTAMAEISSVL